MQPLKLTIHQDNEAFERLKAEWNALLMKSPHPSLFLTWEWISPWWEVFGPRFRLHLVDIRTANGHLVALAPLMIGPGMYRWNRFLRTLMFIGQRGDTLSEYLDFIIEKGWEEPVISLLVEHLAKTSAWDVASLELMPSESPSIPFLQDQAKQRNWSVDLSEPKKSPYLTLPDEWTKLLASKSRNFRSQWNNSLNRLEKSGSIGYLVGGVDLPLETAMEHLMKLHRDRWGHDDGGFRTDAYVAFHHKLSRLLHDQGHLLLMLMTLDNKIVAARYDFLFNKKMWCFQGGWLPELESARVGTIMTGKVIEWGIKNGYGEYDFMTGESSYKDRWASGERTLVDVSITPNKLRAKLGRFLLKLRHLAD